MSDEVKITYKGKEEIVKFKAMSWGEQNNCVRKATKTVNNKKELDEVTLHELRLVGSILSAPFTINLETLRGLPADVGDKLFAVIQKASGVTKEESKNLETPSAETS